MSLERLIGRNFAWHSLNDGTVIDANLFTVDKISGKNYYRTYPDGSGEWMPIDVLISCIRKGKFVSKGLDITGLEKITSKQEREFNRQLDRAENPHKYM